ncbi:MAG: hypothetical protein A4E64_01047 [Syntrophorhabdus sp. PtaU1.Bin058]|nr:MAG: hypothetical protein A4E64_01047 [Syntrophorhabdus sp. PtaU1.Bin058]
MQCPVFLVLSCKIGLLRCLPDAIDEAGLFDVVAVGKHLARPPCIPEPDRNGIDAEVGSDHIQLSLAGKPYLWRCMTPLRGPYGIIRIHGVADVIEGGHPVREHKITPGGIDHDNAAAPVGAAIVIAAHALAEEYAFFVHGGLEVHDHVLAVAEVGKDLLPFSRIADRLAGLHGEE